MSNQKELCSPSDRTLALSAALRRPLTELFAAIDAAVRQEDPPSPALRSSLEAILQSGYRLLRVVTALSLSEQTLQPSEEAFSLWAELSHCLSAVSTLMVHGAFPVIYSFPAQETSVAGNRDALIIALLHLIANALAASSPGSAVEVRGSVTEDQAIISVTDRGRGIAPEQLPFVFQPYYSSDRDGLPFQSLGLGLSLAEEIFRQMGGSIRLVSTQGAGTSAICSLPIAGVETVLPLRQAAPDYLTDRFSPIYTVLCEFITPPWPYE